MENEKGVTHTNFYKFKYVLHFLWMDCPSSYYRYWKQQGKGVTIHRMTIGICMRTKNATSQGFIFNLLPTLNAV